MIRILLITIVKLHFLVTTFIFCSPANVFKLLIIIIWLQK